MEKIFEEKWKKKTLRKGIYLSEIFFLCFSKESNQYEQMDSKRQKKKKYTSNLTISL